ncbi:hypothetical protein LAZ67_1000357 [Cordylochernes scorpioides]|uniref:Uncharacterized protein n=1 Tax=Cordylochernes scorpioides TaxID=51811 RepID=A0ABY6JX38_9ARAC|nr:hypothetical protein LAZ67_1000357 [Cordylochernes scorpioides]
MEANESLTKITKLNGLNYSSWSFQIKLILLDNDLWSIVDPGEVKPEGGDVGLINKFNTRQNKALAKICLSIGEEQNHIRHLNSPKEVWDELQRLYAPRDSKHRILQLRRKLYSQKFCQHANMDAYLRSINLIVSELTGVGDKIEDGDLSMLILCGMPEDWDNVISTMCNLPESEFTSANIRRKLLAEAERRYATTNEGMGALSVRNTNKKQFPHEHQGSKTVRKCFGCGKTGHIARDCFKLKKNNGKQQEKGAIHQHHEAKNLNVMYNAAVVSEEDTWVIDSGATHHMTPNRRYFSTLNDENVGQVTTIDGTSHSNIGRGNAQVDLINNSGQLRSIVAQNAMFVPGIRHGVLSVLQIVENGHEVIFDKKGCHIYDNDHNLMIRAEKRGRLYLVRTAPSRFPESGECSNSIAQTNNFRKFPLNLWHQRLMHINYDTIVDMMKREVVIGLNCQAGKPDKCSDCMIGKSTKRPFLNLRSTKETQTLALVHCDLMGPFNIESWGGSRFVLTIIDDASRYTRVYFLKRKGDTLEKFKEWMKEAENQTGFSLKRIRTDNGLEFCSSPWDIFTKAHGIVHERTMVYTPEQNGVAERMNRTLLNLVRSTVNSCNLPTASWAELTNTAAYLRNRVTNRHNEEKTPFELWFGKRPALQHLRAIGCETFVHVPKQRRNSKLQPRATKGILVGYSLQGRGWRIWIPEKRQVVESRNCVFKEEILYKQPKRERDTLPSVHFSSKEASFQEESNADQPVDRETEELIGTTGGIDQLSETLPENLRSHPMTLRSHGKTAESPEEDNSGRQINATSAEDNNPTYEEAMNSPEVVNWIEAIEEERESLERHDVWQLQELPKGIKPLKCRWVLNKKINAVDGTTRYKARLVAKGFTQRRGIDYNEVYTPVSSFETIRLLTAIATEKNWFIDQFDVKSAYLHGALNETIYMEQPECFKKPGEENLFCKLKKSIYGLKQSGRCWNKFLNKQLHEIGFQRNPIDPSIYEVELEEERIILSIYVDDIFAISENQAARNKCRELLNSSFEVKYLGPISHMLGVSFKKSEDGSMTLSQSNYIEELLQRFRLQDAKGVSTPMETNLGLRVRKNGNSNERFPYRELIGGLSYLSQRTRPDIAYAEAGKRVLRYLKSTKDFGITYRSTGKPLIAFSDASWASDIVDRKGVSGHLIILAGAPIIWRSTKQTVTALSTMESEYIALSSAVKDITWVRNLMEQLKMSSLICGETKVFCDNQAAISHAENYIDKSKTRHFAVKYHFVREKISEEAIELFYTPSAENPADFLTKPLARSQHEKYCRALMDYRNKRPAEVFPGGDMLDTSAPSLKYNTSVCLTECFPIPPRRKYTNLEVGDEIVDFGGEVGPRKPYGTLGQIPPPQQPFDLISIDTIAGFSKYGHSKTYLHVIVDHLTRYAWAFPSKSTSTLTYIQTLKKVLQQGSPKRLLSDRAPAFTSEKFRKFLLSRGIQPLLTTSNNPQANGLIERLNATITGKLRLLYLENPKTSRTKLIKQVVQIYNQSPHTVTGFPPIFLMFNSIPPELKNHYNPFPDVQKARQLASSRTQLKHERDKQRYDKGHQAPHFEIGDLVLVKNYKHPDTGKLAPYFTGPFTIIEIISPNVVRINRPNRPLNKEDDTVHVNKLKYYTEDILFLAPQPLIPTPRIEGMETNRRKLRLKLIRLSVSYDCVFFSLCGLELSPVGRHTSSRGHHVHPRLHNGLYDIDVGVSVHPKTLLKEIGRHHITFTDDNAKDHHGGREFVCASRQVPLRSLYRSSYPSWYLPLGPRRSSTSISENPSMPQVSCFRLLRSSSFSFSVTLHVFSQQRVFLKGIGLETKVLMDNSDNYHRANVHFLGCPSPLTFLTNSSPLTMSDRRE